MLYLTRKHTTAKQYKYLFETIGETVAYNSYVRTGQKYVHLSMDTKNSS